MKEKKEVIIDGEKVYLKEDILGWHVIFPYKNEDGSWNWKNLIAGGSWLKLFLISIFVAIIVIAIFEVAHIVQVANQCQLNQTIPFIINP